MSKGDTFENDFLKLVFLGTAIANIADNAASGPLTSLWLSLHTAAVGETGNQATNEIAYGGYVRTSACRAAAGWEISASTVVNSASIGFPACSGASGAAVHFAVGSASSGTGKVLYSGSLTASLAVTNGVTPRFAASALQITED